MIRAMGKCRRPRGGSAESLLVVEVGKPSWRKEFPGAEVEKTGWGWPGEDGLEEYSRESERLG